jgi:hypothetical protein
MLPACVLLACANAVITGDEPGGAGGPLAALWPALRGGLPLGYASLSLGAAAPADGSEVSAAGLALGFRHCNAAWTLFGGGLAASRSIEAGPDLPDRIDRVHGVIGAWRRLTLDDHLLIVALPGQAWVPGGTEAQRSCPVAGVFLHRSGEAWLGGGLLVLEDKGSPLVLPVAAAFLAQGEWRFALTPVWAGAERLLGPDAAAGIETSLNGDAAPILWEGQRRTFSVWDWRVGAHGRWRMATGLEWSLEAGWSILRGATVGGGFFDDADLERDLAPGPYVRAGCAFSW